MARWLTSPDAHRSFLAWCAYGPHEIRCRAQLVVLAWLPQDTLDEFAHASAWIDSLGARSREHAAARRLADALLDEWHASGDCARSFACWRAERADMLRDAHLHGGRS